jgi:hypothetical protein
VIRVIGPAAAWPGTCGPVAVMAAIVVRGGGFHRFCLEMQ